MTVFARFGSVLRPPGARAALGAAIFARVSLGMTGLSLLLVVKAATGSYARAGFVSAAYAIAFAVATPVWARAADRRGPRPVLLTCTTVHPLAFVAEIVLTSVHAPWALDAAAALLIGFTVPPAGGVMRALWGELVDAALLPVAYALEAIVIEICFMIGPLLVAAVSVAVSPRASLACSAGFACSGVLALAANPVVRRIVPHPTRPTHFAGPLVSAVVRANLLCVLFVGVAFGSTEVGVLAFVEGHGHTRSVAGVLLAVWSVGSALGGLLYGALHVQADATRQWPVLVTLLGCATALPLLAPSVLWLAVLLLLGGSAIAPWSSINSVLLGRGAPAGTTTEAFAWSGSMIFGGMSLGTAIAGAFADAHGATGAFGTAALGGLCLVAASSFAVRTLRPVPIC